MRFRHLITSISVMAFMLSPFSAEAQDLGIKLNSVAPGGTVETLDGRKIELRELIKGKPTLLEFWATWCGNCKQLEPAMLAAHKKYGGRMNFVAVAVSLNQTVERVKGYQERYKLPFTFVYDRHGDISEAYDAPATSYIVIIDQAGKVVYTGTGGTQNLDAAISKTLSASSN